jgi:hypothetical protein
MKPARKEWIVEFCDTRNFFSHWSAWSLLGLPKKWTLKEAMSAAKENEEDPHATISWPAQPGRIHYRIHNLSTGDIIPAAIL